MSATGRDLVEYVGRYLDVLPWERQFLERFVGTRDDLAITMARGNGKSALCAAIACAILDGPLRREDSEVVLVASSFSQACIMGRDAVTYLGAQLEDRAVWRKRDTSGVFEIEHRPTRARLKVVGSDPRRMHGLRCTLALCDEPAKWPPTTSEAAIAALRTSMGKHPGGSQLVALGTRPDDGDHWFSKMLKEPGSMVHASRPDDPPFQRRTWKRANPSLDAFPWLEDRLRLEAAKAKRDPVAMASFRALRLNLGTSDVIEAHLLTPGTWASIEGEAAAVGPWILGVDCGSTEAMSAACGFWPETGSLRAVACFGNDPSPKERGLRDGVGGLYSKMESRAELVLSEGRISDLGLLLSEVWNRWGQPAAIVSDRWRDAELRKVLSAAGYPRLPLILRGQGFKDGAADVRAFLSAVLEGYVTPERSLLLSSAMANARIISDPAGNRKLAKGSQGGRHVRSRDDACAAAILAVSLGWRKALQEGGAESGVRSMIV